MPWLAARGPLVPRGKRHQRRQLRPRASELGDPGLLTAAPAVLRVKVEVAKMHPARGSRERRAALWVQVLQ